MTTSAPTTTDYSPVVTQLQQQIESDSTLATALTSSLVAANNAASGGDLNSDLYAALNQLYEGNGWPTTSDNYLDFLTLFEQIIPSENTDPGYSAWNNTDTQNGYSQEVYDRLCHFYWLIDQDIVVDGDTIVLQHYVSADGQFKFADWLVSYSTEWGNFLNTPESLTNETLISFAADDQYKILDYSEDANNWDCFNKFFYRELNPFKDDGTTPMRPIADPDQNTTVCSPADCTFKATYPVDDEGNIDAIVIKETHTYASVSQLLNDSPYSDAFNGGTFSHYFLSPFDYHRFHTPVSGKVLTSEKVDGQMFLDVQVDDNGQFDAPDSSEGGYEFTQARGVIIIDTADSPHGNIGKVAVVPIGMAQVSSVHMTMPAGTDATKGDEFGYFAFGGSDIILVFEKNANLELVERDAQNNPIHFMYGQATAYWNGKP